MIPNWEGNLLTEDEGSILLEDGDELLIEDASLSHSGIGTRAIAKRYPAVDGLTAETTYQTGHKENLIPELGTLVPRRYRI